MDSDRLANVIKELEAIAEEGADMPPIPGAKAAATHLMNLGKVAGALDILREVKASEFLIQVVNKVRSEGN